MIHAKNIIRRQSVNFHFNGNEDGMIKQQEVAAWCRDVLNPQIDSLLKNYETTDDVISINNIKLDFTVDGNASWQQELTEKVIKQLKEKLGDGITQNKDGVVLQKLSQNFASSLLYFLEHGFLSWNTQIKNKEEFEESFSVWLSEASSSEINYLLRHLDSEKKIERLINTISENSIISFISAVTVQPKEYVSLLMNDIRAMINNNLKARTDKEHLHNSFVIQYILFLQQGNEKQSSAELVQQWIINLIEDKKIDADKISVAEIKTAELKESIHQIQKKYKQNISLKKISTKELKEEFESEKEKVKSKKNDGALNKELAEGVFINNAGAVIIAPFFSMLFSNTGIAKDNVVIDKDAALALIHYCITGNTNPAEFELLLPKILCGINAEEVVNANKIINQKYLNEADEMLASVIEYWSVLKGTSADGLREAFLQREGKLSFSNDKWLLQVEQKPYDMLLQQLPWNISMIKLPWMEHVLITEWI